MTLVAAALSELCIRVLWLPSDGKKRRLIFSQLLIQRVQDGFSGFGLANRMSYFLSLSASRHLGIRFLAAVGCRKILWVPPVPRREYTWPLVDYRVTWKSIDFKHGLQFERQ